MAQISLNDGLKVYVQDDVKFVRAAAVLCSCTARAVDLVNRTVPVYEGRSLRQIGSASLYLSQYRVVALISFDYATPERLNLEINTPVYASFLGLISVDARGVATINIKGIDLVGRDELLFPDPSTQVALAKEL